MKKIIYTTFFLWSLTNLQAQHDVQYTHFLFNKLAYNPAYAGAAGEPSLLAIYRNQWLNLDGAPKTATANFHTPFFGSRSGFGIGVTADRVGMLQNNYLNVSYAYRFSVGKGKLSAGVNGRLEQGKVNWNEASPLDIGDGAIPSNENAKVRPNFGFGLYYEQSNFYLGLSIPQLLNTTLYRDIDIVDRSTDYRTYYLMTGFLTHLSSAVKFQPGAMISFNAEAPFELDVNANLIFMDAFWIGGNYRLGDSFAALVQYQFTPQFRAGAAFDFTMSELKSYTNGSMEVMLSYIFAKKDKTVEQVNNLRFF